jgi:2-polyprenyl-6-methoxyphenol hydroxylase-like FAD-dependent oxidoreductase
MALARRLEQAAEIRAAGAGIGLWENALREFDRIGIGAEVRGRGSRSTPGSSPLPRWTGAHVALIGDAAHVALIGDAAHVALIGDAAHGLSPHISAGGTLGIEDAGVLRTALETAPGLAVALTGYEQARMAHFDRVRELAAAVENASGPAEFAERYAAFSHWMLSAAPQ